jgi:hypothetical protein
METSEMAAQRTVNMGGKAVPVDAQGRPDINAILGGYVDRGIWTYYYTIKIGAGSTVGTQYSFFGASIGQTDPYNTSSTLTKLETNIPNANFFNPPRDLILDQLGFVFSYDTRVADMTSLLKNSYFEFKIDEKIFFEGGMDLHPPGVGLTGMSTQTTESAWNIGTASPTAVVKFGNFSKYIAPMQRYSLILYFPETTPTTLASGSAGGTGTGTTATGLWLRAFMKGLTDRAVQ